MITKERLEQLIKEKATIWHDDYGRIPLNETSEICKYYYMNNKFSHFVICGKYDVYQYELDIRELEEDVETAEWHSEMDCRRWEELEFPTWKEVTKIPNTRMFCEFYVDDCDDVYKYTLDRDIERDELIIIQYNVLEDAGDIIWSEKFNKENYKTACKKCGELFLGGDICQSE